MSLLNARSAVAVALLFTTACDQRCFDPADEAATECEVVEPAEVENGLWTLAPGAPILDPARLCAARCIDSRAPVFVSNSADLRQVPLLRKLRQVANLRIDAVDLPDLRGLEHVDVTDVFQVAADGASKTFKSLNGLGDRELNVLILDNLGGLQNFDASRFDRLNNFSASDTAMQTIDLSSLELKRVTVTRSHELVSLVLGTGVMESFTLSTTSVSEFRWGQPLSVQNYDISTNRNLSSCLAFQFTRATDPGGYRQGLLLNNGPCP